MSACSGGSTSSTTGAPDASDLDSSEPPSCTGECVPGERRLSSEGCDHTFRSDRCSNDCVWEPEFGCGEGCGDLVDNDNQTDFETSRRCVLGGWTALAVPEVFVADEDQVDSGESWGGSGMLEGWTIDFIHEEASVYVQTFAIDTFSMVDEDGHVTPLSRTEVEARCAARGGRLPTYEEFERYARGPNGTPWEPGIEPAEPVCPEPRPTLGARECIDPDLTRFESEAEFRRFRDHARASGLVPRGLHAEDRFVRPLNFRADEFASDRSPFGVRGVIAGGYVALLDAPEAPQVGATYPEGLPRRSGLLMWRGSALSSAGKRSRVSRPTGQCRLDSCGLFDLDGVDFAAGRQPWMTGRCAYDVE
jgi:hypothetical protein